MEITEHRNGLELVFDNTVQQIGVCGHFSVPHPDAWHMRKKFAHLKDWDGLIKFCKPKFKGSSIYRLEAGFKNRLEQFLKAEGLQYNITPVDLPPPGVFSQELHEITLDDTQASACQALLNNRRAVIELGTASGKTEIFINAFLCLHKANPKLRGVVIVPRKGLLEQTIKRIKARCPQFSEIGIVGDGKFEINTPLVVATSQTACGHDKLTKSAEIQAWMKTLDVLVLDEAHHAGSSQQWQDIIEQCTAKWVWGVSAKVTFWDPKNEVKHYNLEGMFGPPVFQGRSEERTADVSVVFYHNTPWKDKFKDSGLAGGYVDMMPATFRLSYDQPWQSGHWRGADQDTCPEFCLMPNPKDVLTFSEDGSPVYKPEAMVDGAYNPERRIPDRSTFGVYIEDPKAPHGWRKIETETENVIYWNRHDIAIMEFNERNQWCVSLCQAFAQRKQAFAVACRRKRHTKRVATMLVKAGLNISVCTSSMNATQQEAVMSKVRNGEVQGVVANYTMISEGTDLPNLIHLVKMDGISEEQVLNQQKGRVQRVFEGKARGFLHIPRDLQHPALDRICGHMVSYFRSLKDPKITIKKLIVA